MTENTFDEARRAFREYSLPRTDNAALIDWVDYLEENGYHGSINLEPELRPEDVVFEVALAVGYELGRNEADG